MSQKGAFFSSVPSFAQINITGTTKIWKKQILVLGSWIHPQNPEMVFTITPEVCDQAVKNFEKGFPMDLPIVLTHSDNPKMKVGFARSLIKEADGLYAMLAVDDADMNLNIENVAKAPGVSCWLDLNYLDKSTGNPVGAVVKHVALVNHPYIEGMKGFEQVLSLSEGENREEFVPLVLSEKRIEQEKTSMTKQEAVDFLKTDGVDVEKLISLSEEFVKLTRRIDEGELVEAKVLLSDDIRKSAVEVLQLSEADSKDLNKIISTLVDKLKGSNVAVDRLAKVETELSEMKAGTVVDNLIKEGRALPAEKVVLTKLFLSNMDLFEETRKVRMEGKPLMLSEIGLTTPETLDKMKAERETQQAEINRHVAAAAVEGYIKK
jgi:hypothetical protein